MDGSAQARGAQGPLLAGDGEGPGPGLPEGVNGGTWIARFHDPAVPRLFKPLGVADDLTDADGVMILSCAQAQEKAREWFRTAYFQATGERVPVGIYTVANAVEDYLEDRDRHGMKNVDRVRKDFAAHVLTVAEQVLLV